MRWIQVTGGCSSGVGKGCLSAALGRQLALSGLRVGYQKIEPCLQSDLAKLANTHFGEISLGRDGQASDSDVARARFYIPDVQLGKYPDLSLGRLMGDWISSAGSDGLPAPRLRDVSGRLLALLPKEADVLLIEVGGTSGEEEHSLVTRALVAALGKAALHLHLTAVVSVPGGRQTTKPAQLSIAALTDAPDLVLLRGAAGTAEPRAALSQGLPAGSPIVLVEEDYWPERAYARALNEPDARRTLLAHRVGATTRPDSLLEDVTTPTHRVVVVHDGAGPEGYTSLGCRLLAWSHGRIAATWETSTSFRPPLHGIIRIGETAPSQVDSLAGIPYVEIVPVAQGAAPRTWADRPDWHGTADKSEGVVANFVTSVLTHHFERVAGLAYSEPDFARRYLSASTGGELRDHRVLDPLVESALPAGARLKTARLLDVGCGDGRWAARLVDKGAAHIVGVEAAPPMADAAARRSLPRFTLIRSPIETADITGPFDAVLASMSLDHVETLEIVLRKLAAYLVPGGRLVMTTEHPLRTAPLSGSRWAEDGPRRAARVCDYVTEGVRTFHWFGMANAIAVFHRPVGSMLKLLRAAGLEIVTIAEPVSDAARDGGVPRFWMIVAERPGPQRQTIAIDGPSASGKSTIGDLLAQRLGWTHLDSGLINRLFAFRQHHGLSAQPVSAAQVGMQFRWQIGSREIEPAVLRTEAIGSAAAQMPRTPELNAEIESLFEHLCSADQMVVSGRGVGRYIRGPLARFYVDAAADVRARRRGTHAAQLHARDEEDRAAGQLLPPDIDAVVLDNSDSEPSRVVGEMETVVRTRLRQMRDRASGAATVL